MLKQLFGNLGIRYKLLVVASIPLLGMLVFSGYNTLMAWKGYGSSKAEMTLTGISVAATNLVHEIQKERGYTAGFLGSKGKTFARERIDQGAKVDDLLAKFSLALKDIQLAKYGVAYEGLVTLAQSDLSQLDNMRQRVRNQAVKTPEAIGYYTGMNKKLLDVVGYLVTYSHNRVLERNAQAYIHFALAKERAGIERAVMANTFARGSFGDGMFVKFVRLVAEQNTYTSEFLKSASDKQIDFFERQMDDNSVKEVARMRVAALTGDVSSRNITASYWFSTITDKINILKRVENELASNVFDYAKTVRDSSRSTFLFFSLLFVV